MPWISPEGLDHLITIYGYLAISVVICIESRVLLPGETMLILAAMYAVKNPDLNI